MAFFIQFLKYICGKPSAKKPVRPKFYILANAYFYNELINLQDETGAFIMCVDYDYDFLRATEGLELYKPCKLGKAHGQDRLARFVGNR